MPGFESSQESLCLVHTTKIISVVILQQRIHWRRPTARPYGRGIGVLYPFKSQRLFSHTFVNTVSYSTCFSSSTSSKPVNLILISTYLLFQPLLKCFPPLRLFPISANGVIIRRKCRLTLALKYKGWRRMATWGDGSGSPGCNNQMRYSIHIHSNK